MYSCAYCEYSTSYLQNLKRHEKNKHDKSKHVLSQTGSGADVPMEQTAPSHFHNGWMDLFSKELISIKLLLYEVFANYCNGT